MAKITWDNKVASQTNPLPEINKWTAENANEVKDSIDALYDLSVWQLANTGIYYENVVSLENDYKVLHQAQLGTLPALISGTVRNPLTNDAMALANAYADIIVGDNEVGLSRPSMFVVLGNNFFNDGPASGVNMGMSPVALDEQNDGLPLFSVGVINNPYGDNFGFKLSYDGTLKNYNGIQIGDVQANHQLAAGQIVFDGTSFKGYDGSTWSILGGGIGTLGQVLTSGNYTDEHDINVTIGDRIVTGSSRAGLGRGSTDRGIGGDNGVSLYCSIEKELNFQGGWLTNYGAGGFPEEINMGSSLSFGSGLSLNDGGLNYSVFPHERKLVNASATPIIDWSTGEMYDDNGIISLGLGQRQLFYLTNQPSIDYENSVLYGPENEVSIQYANRELRDIDGETTLAWQITQLIDKYSEVSADWSVRELYDYNGVVSLKYDTGRYLVTDGGVNSVAWNDFVLQDETGGAIVLDWRDGAKHAGKWSFNNQITSETSTGWTATGTYTPTKTFSSSLTATTIQVADTLATLLTELRTKGIISA